MKSRSFKSIFNVCVLFVLVMVSFAMPSSITQAAPLSANPLAAACGTASFSAATNFGTGSGPYSVAVGDFNGDGKPDLATANGSANVSVLLGNGNGTFGAATNFSAGATPISVAVGDFNGDGKQDLAVANTVNDDVSVLLGNGAGSFGATTIFGAGVLPFSVAVGDFNGDGKQDLATANNGGNNVSVLLGNGNGTFGAATNFDVGSLPVSVAVGDFNGDGKPDLAVANYNGSSISVLLGNGAGSFGAATNFGVGAFPISVAVGDFNGDGKPDLATANFSGGNVSVLLGNGNGTFGAATNFGAGTNPNSVAVGDFNGDGKPDLAVANYNGNNVSVLLGNGVGSFGTATNFGAGITPYSVAVGDFNGDGKPDLAVANQSSNNVSVLLNNCDASSPTVTVEQAVGQADPTGTSPINFTVTFSEPINIASFVNADVTLGGTAGATTAVISEIAPNNGTTFNLAVSGMTTNGTVIASIDVNKVQDLNGNNNIASTSVDNTVTFDTGIPSVIATSLQTTYTTTGLSTFTVTFSEDVYNPAGDTDTDDVTNPNNFLLIEKGPNGIPDTLSCAGDVKTDDVKVTAQSVVYVNPTAIVTLTTPLPVGNYRLFVCGTTSIVDLAGNPLAGDGITSGTDFTFDFTVGAATASTRTGNKTTASTLPKTGFAPNKITSLPAQPATLAYAKLGDLWLEIPSLNVKSTIVGVPQNADKTWDVSWLGNDTGWLNGTAFPTWNGNSVLTAHVVNASGLEGPFAALKSLKYGDQVIVHFGGVKYVYEVRVTKLARPYTTNFTFESKSDASYLTLITCQGYNPLNGSYLFRRVVRAVLVEVK